MLVFERQVLQFLLHLIQSKPIGQGSIYIERFSCYLILFCRQLAAQCTHIVQTVTDLYENDADVIAHSEEEFFECLRLSRGLVAEYSSAYLSDSIHYLRNLRSENILDIFYGVVRILYHIVQKGGADTSAAQTYLTANDLSNGQRMHNVRFAR